MIQPHESRELREPREPREIAERYRLEKILRSSRAANVMRAVDLASGEAVTVKLLAPGVPPGEELERAYGRFLPLAEGLAGLSHPALPAVRDFGITPDGSAFLVTELLAGRGLDTLAGGSPRRLLGLLAEVVDALRLLAARGLAHGNLSPDNLLALDGGSVKVLGLGTAALRGPVPADSPTARFRAPEELAGMPGMQVPAVPASPVEGWRADLYSLARTACQILKVEVTFAESPEPRVTIPLGLGFLLADAEALRLLLDAALRRNAEDRPSLERAASALRQAIGAQEAAAPPLAATGASAATAACAEETRPAFVPPADSTGAADPGDQPASGHPALPSGAPDLSHPMAGDRSAVPPGIPGIAAVAGIADPGTLTGGRPAVLPGTVMAPPSAAEPSPAAAASGVEGETAAELTAAVPVDDPPEEEALPDVDGMLEAEIAAPAAAGAAKPAPPVPALGHGVPAADAAAKPAPGSAAGKSPGQSWRRMLRPLPLAAAAAVLLLLAVVILWLASRGEAPPAPVALQSSAPAPPPLEPPAVRLAAASDALAVGDDHRALAVLRSLTPADQEALPAGSCDLIRRLEATLVATAGERLAHDLENGFATGSPALLRLATRAAEEEPQALEGQPREVLERLERARRAVDLHRQAEEASRRGDVVGTLDRFGALAALLPDLRDEDGLRERAAVGLEQEADGLVREARYEEALARLEPLSRTWPERPGLSSRLAACREQQRAESKIEGLLASAANAEKRRKPDEGVALLRGATPTPHLESQYREAVARLEAQLGKLDGQPPQVELRDGYLLEFARGTVANVSVRVRDDYEVRSVKFYARPEGSSRMVELPYERSGAAYSVEIPPSFHHNADVDLYVVATDVSGHQSSLGSREKPLKIRRSRGFREAG